MRIETFRFGKFIFQVEFPLEIEHQINMLLHEYRCNNYDSDSCVYRFIICVSQKNVYVDEKTSAWNCNMQFENSKICYTQNGIVLFSILYKSNKMCQIEVANPMQLYLRIALQFAVMLSLADQCMGLHGVVTICKDRVIVLSAPSGTGKTTLSKLLQKHHQAAVINGDFALLSGLNSNEVFFEPTPFCGSSNICHNYRLKVDRIVFLEQANKNQMIDIGGRESLVRILSNSFVPEWDERAKDALHSFAAYLINMIPISVFRFAPNEDAAHLFYNCVTK